MFWGTVGIIAAAMTLALLLANLIFNSRVHAGLKAAALIACLWFYASVYLSISPMMGWATSHTLPKRFNLMAVHVQEPNKETSAKGHIYLWLTDMEQVASGAQPRAYKVPFSPALHARVVEAATKLRKNLPQLGELQNTVSDVAHTGPQAPSVLFFDMPGPLFPEK